MTEHHHRTTLACLQRGFLNHGGQFALAPVDGECLLSPDFHLSLWSKCLGERLLHLVGKHRREYHLSLGVHQHHRRYPLHAIGLCYGRLTHLLQLAQLSPCQPVFGDGILPCRGIVVEGDTHELHTLRCKVIIHALHAGNVFPAIGTPRCPEVNQRPAALGQLAQLHLLPVGRSQGEVGCRAPCFHQFGSIFRVSVVLLHSLCPTGQPPSQRQGKKHQSYHFDYNPITIEGL